MSAAYDQVGLDLVARGKKVEPLGHKQRHCLLDELPADGVEGIGAVDPEESLLRVDQGGLEAELAYLRPAGVADPELCGSERGL
jgi:hypothetical protein